MKRIRKCPTCCPDVAAAYFEPTGDAENEYACNNCGHRVVIRRRPRKVGDERQARVVARVKDMLADRYNLADRDQTGFWSERGTVCLSASPKRWYDDGMLIYVGPRGALKVVDHRDERRARSAWTWLSVVSSR